MHAAGGAMQVFVPAFGAGMAGPFVQVAMPGMMGGGAPGGMPAAAYVDLDALGQGAARPVLDYGDL
jgi:hypothetical protein